MTDENTSRIFAIKTDKIEMDTFSPIQAVSIDKGLNLGILRSEMRVVQVEIREISDGAATAIRALKEAP